MLTVSADQGLFVTEERIVGMYTDVMSRRKMCKDAASLEDEVPRHRKCFLIMPADKHHDLRLALKAILLVLE